MIATVPRRRTRKPLAGQYRYDRSYWTRLGIDPRGASHWTMTGPGPNGCVRDELSGNNGALNGGVSWQPGSEGMGLKFDGSTGYVSLPVGLIGKGAINFWALGHPVTNGKFPSWVNDGALDFSKLEFCYDTNNTVFAVAGSGFGGGPYPQVSDSTWHMFTLSSDGTTGSFFIDSVFKKSFAFAFNSASFLVAKGFSFFGGMMGSLAILRSPPTTAQISAIYANHYGWAAPSLGEQGIVGVSKGGRGMVIGSPIINSRRIINSQCIIRGASFRDN